MLVGLAKEAGLVNLVNTPEPRGLPWPVEQAATMERLVTDGRRLLFDAGCRIFTANLVSQFAQAMIQAAIDDNQVVDEAAKTGLPMAQPSASEPITRAK